MLTDCGRLEVLLQTEQHPLLPASKPRQVLVFVSSRRQTRLTALDLMAYAAADDRPRAFLHLSGARVLGARWCSAPLHATRAPLPCMSSPHRRPPTHQPTDHELEQTLGLVKDASLRHTLQVRALRGRAVLCCARLRDAACAAAGLHPPTCACAATASTFCAAAVWYRAAPRGLAGQRP